MTLKSGLIVSALLVSTACGEGRPSESLVYAEPSRVDFGPVLVRRETTRLVRLYNNADRPLLVRRFLPDEALQLAVEVLRAPTILPAEAATPVEVAFRPNRPGRWVGDLSLDFDLMENLAPVLVPVSGLALEGVLVGRPNRVDFGRVRLGEVATATVVVQNFGPSPIPLRALPLRANSSPAFSAVLPAMITLDPGQEQSAQIRFAPVERGTHSGVVEATTDSRDPPGLSVELYGEAEASNVVVEPTSVSFGEVFVNESRRRRLRFRNLGFEALKLEGPILVATSTDTAPLDFRLEGMAPQPWLEPGEPWEVDLVYTPARIGLHEAWVVLAGLQDQVELLVRGTATDSVAAQPYLAGPPLDFGRVQVGHRTRRRVRLDVLGTTPLPASAEARVEPQDSPFRLVDEVGRVQAGDRRHLRVELYATTPGQLAAVLRVGTATRALTAEVVQAATPELTAWPEAVHFGAVQRGFSSIRSLRVSAEGTAPVAALRATVSPPYSVLGQQSLDLEPGTAIDLRIGFTDGVSIEGERLGKLQLAFDGGQLTVPLGATVVMPEAASAELEVVLHWSEAADLDLHLALDSADVFDAPGSACFCNPQPDWGVPGDVLDDPWLDANRGVGPATESIRLQRAGEEAYRLEVTHAGGAEASAELEVRAAGAVLRPAQVRRLGPGQRWLVGRVVRSGNAYRLERADVPLVAESRRFCH